MLLTDMVTLFTIAPMQDTFGSYMCVCVYVCGRHKYRGGVCVVCVWCGVRVWCVCVCGVCVCVCSPRPGPHLQGSGPEEVLLGQA